MRIQLEATGKVVACFSKEELLDYELSFQRLCADNPNTRRLIGELISRIAEQTGIDFSNRRLLLEAYPHQGGCMLRLGPAVERRYRKKKRYRAAFHSPAALDFDSLEAVRGTFHGLCRRLVSTIAAAELYHLPERYRLLLYLTAQPQWTEAEQRHYIGQGILPKAEAIEKGQLLARFDGMERLKYHL